MIQELIDKAQATDLRSGDCLEVHVDTQGEVNIMGAVRVHSFARTWGYAMDLDHCLPVSRRWLGIVHEDGAVAVQL